MKQVEILVEEPSAEALLKVVVPKILGPQIPSNIRVFQGKHDLLKRLPERLGGYAQRISREDLRIVVTIDRDAEDCLALKARLEQLAAKAGLGVWHAKTAAAGGRVMNRIVVTELESWLLGDVAALRAVYPKLPASLSQKKGMRDPDSVVRAWETLERELQARGYHRAGLPKVVVAREVAAHMNINQNASRSFNVFRDGLQAFVGCP